MKRPIVNKFDDYFCMFACVLVGLGRRMHVVRINWRMKVTRKVTSMKFNATEMKNELENMCDSSLIQ